MMNDGNALRFSRTFGGEAGGGGCGADVTVYDCPLPQQYVDMLCAMQIHPVIQCKSYPLHM